MNTNRNKPAPTTSNNPRRPHPAPEQDFDELSQQDSIVEHLTIPGFLRRVPHKWHIDEITRFGDKVGRAAESLQLSYMTRIDRSLGVIRVFPVPLLQRIYEILAPQFGWPQIIEIEPPALDDPRRAHQETLRSNERLMKHNRALLAITENVEVQHSISVVLQWLEHDCQRIRKELGIPEPEQEAAS